MRITVTGLSLIAVAFAAGCSDTQIQQTTSPSLAPRLDVTVGTPCQTSIANNVANQFPNIYDPSVVPGAQAAWAAVTGSCASDLEQSRDLMLAYIRFSIEQWKAGKIIANGNRLTSHWNLAFTYVAYAQPQIPASMLSSGAIYVVRRGETREFGIPGQAAMTVPAQDPSGETRGHLFTISPANAPCLGATNLEQSGPCFDFNAYPHQEVAFDPRIRVGICHPDEGDNWELGLPSLGHTEDYPLKVAGDVSGIYPSLEFCHGTESSPTPRFGVMNLLRRFASALPFSVERAYAAHGGLGGISGTLSVWGIVDREVFAADFSDDPVNQPPQDPEDGSLTLVFEPPASILVKDSIGDMRSAVVLRHPANTTTCTACERLEMWAIFHTAEETASADHGIYAVEWKSLEALPFMARAPIVLRSTDSLEIARLTYSQVTARGVTTNQLRFNGVPVGTWVKGITQKFKITIDLDHKTTSLAISDVPVASAQGVGFANAAASNIGSLRAEFSFIDVGQFAWNGILAQRLADE